MDEKMYNLLNKCYNQLRDCMTSDDLAYILKEQRLVKVPKIEGRIFKHLQEWRESEKSFKNVFKKGSYSGDIEEVEFLNKRLGELSYIWDRYRKSIESAACHIE